MPDSVIASSSNRRPLPPSAKPLVHGHALDVLVQASYTSAAALPPDSRAEQPHCPAFIHDAVVPPVKMYLQARAAHQLRRASAKPTRGRRSGRRAAPWQIAPRRFQPCRTSASPTTL